MSSFMASPKTLLLFCTISLIRAESSHERFSGASKRAVNTYQYPVPNVAFAPAKDSNFDNRVVVETISSQGRYLPPLGPSPSASDDRDPNNQNPFNVSYEAYEHDEEHSFPVESSSSQPAAPSPALAAPVPPAQVSITTSTTLAPTTTKTKSKSSGGLGAFKYYGGKGKKTTTTVSSNSAALASPVSTLAPLPAPVFKPIQVAPVETGPVQVTTFRPSYKDTTYNYPSPKNPLKPSKKEQRLSLFDSRGEESSQSSQGYEYDVGPGSFLNGVDTYSSGVVSNPAPFVHQTIQNPAPAGNGMMGLSYMRHSSPHFSYHVMLD